MKSRVLLDTGPLVASLNGHDSNHQWAKSQWSEINPPFLTCESVISEACFLLNDVEGAGQAVVDLLRRQIIIVEFRLSEHLEPVSRLMKKYSDVPMSFADACLVRMAEQFHDSAIFTLDSDFKLYRKHGRQVIPLIIPSVSQRRT